MMGGVVLCWEKLFLDRDWGKCGNINIDFLGFDRDDFGGGENFKIFLRFYIKIFKRLLSYC